MECLYKIREVCKISIYINTHIYKYIDIYIFGLCILLH